MEQGIYYELKLNEGVDMLDTLIVNDMRWARDGRSSFC